MEKTIMNHCALCGVEIEPEEEFCERCKEEKDLVKCPICGKIICECETGAGE